jgi:hypothetical protein
MILDGTRAAPDRGTSFKNGVVARSAADDPVVGATIVRLGRARLVDLDPEQQIVSQIWGLRLRLASPTGGPAMTGDFKVAAFTDIWVGRLAGGGGGDFAATAYYQSLITGIEWGDLFGSRFLSELKQASDPSLLSIKFNVDGFDQTTHIGRIVGTIGPASASEPAHFVVGRQCMGRAQGPVWYFCASVDTQRKKLIADFGNALQTTLSAVPSIQRWICASELKAQVSSPLLDAYRSDRPAGTNRPPGFANFRPTGHSRMRKWRNSVPHRSS